MHFFISLNRHQVPDRGSTNLRSGSTGFHPASSNGYTPVTQSNPLMTAHSSSMPNVTNQENDEWANGGDAWTTVTRSRPGRSSVPTMTSAQSVSASTDRESKWAKVRVSLVHSPILSQPLLTSHSPPGTLGTLGTKQPPRTIQIPSAS